MSASTKTMTEMLKGDSGTTLGGEQDDERTKPVRQRDKRQNELKGKIGDFIATLNSYSKGNKERLQDITFLSALAKKLQPANYKARTADGIARNMETMDANEKALLGVEYLFAGKIEDTYSRFSSASNGLLGLGLVGGSDLYNKLVPKGGEVGNLKKNPQQALDCLNKLHIKLGQKPIKDAIIKDLVDEGHVEDRPKARDYYDSITTLLVRKIDALDTKLPIVEDVEEVAADDASMGM